MKCPWKMKKLLYCVIKLLLKNLAAENANQWGKKFLKLYKAAGYILTPILSKHTVY